MAQGVLFDNAQSWYQISLAYQVGDATPTLHLYSSDDTPTPSVTPAAYVELSNDSYAPLPVPDGYWQFLTSPPPDHYGILGAAWHLAPPDIGDDTVIHGWWLDAFSPRAGTTFYLYGGRFDSPVTIPPAGLTLTLAEVDLFLHDCGTSPPPPSLPVKWLDPFVDTQGVSLAAHAPIVGSAYTIGSGTWEIGLATAFPVSTGASDSFTFDPGVSDSTISATCIGGLNGSTTLRPALLARVQNAGNFYALIHAPDVGFLGLYAYAGGSGTLITSSSPPSAGARVAGALDWSLNGTTQHVFLDGVLQFTATDATYPTGTTCGVVVFRNLPNPGGWIMNLQVRG